MSHMPVDDTQFDDDAELLFAFGELKPIEDWAVDPRCVVSLKTLRERIYRGIPPEKAITLNLSGSVFVGKKPAEEPRLIEAFGERKTLAEWKDDYLCKVSVATIRERLEQGLCAEDAISLKVRTGGRKRKSANNIIAKQVLAFGESKSLREWLEDERCVVPFETLKHRIKKGWEPEFAMTSPPAVRSLAPIQAFGEVKTLAEWADDYRCAVAAQTIGYRLSKGWAPEEAISTPAGRPYSKQIEAFGESKTIAEWSRDPRCKSNYRLLLVRLRLGQDPETAITTPVHRPHLYITAFGETKKTAQWVNDSRCVVSQMVLWKRISTGWDPEAAITTPANIRYLVDESGQPRVATPTITAFGETKTVHEWASDPRCTGTAHALIGRLRKGLVGEAALTLQNTRASLGPITAFGETKLAKKWAEDPRMEVEYHTFCFRIRQGIAP